MARLADVFSEQERTNWLKAWMAIDIAKSGLEQFVDTEAKNAHSHFYQNVWSSLQAPAVCIGCNTANLLKCPTPGTCNKRGPNGLCISMHDTQSKQHRPCPLNICDQIRKQIEQAHRYGRPTWKCTSAKRWASDHWEMAKSYFSPDGYDGKSSVKDTDFNGVISFLLNCTLFDSTFSFAIAPSKPNPPCLLTKAREMCKSVRHSSQCKVTDAELHEYFTTLTELLSDSTCLAHDSSAQDAVHKLQELKKDKLKITTGEMIPLLMEAQLILQKVEHNAEKAVSEINLYTDTSKEEIKAQTVIGKEEIRDHTDQCKNEIEDQTTKCKDGIDRTKRLAIDSIRTAQNMNESSN